MYILAIIKNEILYKGGRKKKNFGVILGFIATSVILKLFNVKFHLVFVVLV